MNVGTGVDDGHVHPMRVREHIKWGRIILWVLAIAVGAILLWVLATNKNLQWEIVGDYIVAPVILEGVAATIWLSVISQVIATVLGFFLAYAGQTRNSLLQTFSKGFIWLFRATPLLVQLLLWYNLSLLFPRIGLSIPMLGIDWSVSTNTVISGTTAAILGLGLHEAAYMAEIFRGGIVSVPAGQTEAAQSLGMTRGRAMSRIVIPQALRSIIPPTGNQFIGLLKASSLVSVIGGGELLTQAQYIYGATYAVIPLLLVASIWYIVIVTVASVGQHYLERALDHSTVDPQGTFRFALERLKLSANRRTGGVL